MFSGHIAQLMAEYNRWINTRLYDACERLSDTQRKEARGAFFGSLHATLEHLVWGDGVWLSRFNGKTYSTAQPGESHFPDFGKLRAERVFLDQEILDWANSVDQQWLDEPMTWTSRLYSFTQTQPRWVQVMQMFNHQTHHRGQATTLLSQFGIDYGPTDLPVLPLLNEP
ncbi:MAG TPA: DinB family protein, partial [Rhodocyclaceae bacterium]|nr:DinB family protein [Rhodocyclaceae bacterium]